MRFAELTDILRAPPQLFWALCPCLMRFAELTDILRAPSRLFWALSSGPLGLDNLSL
jgi:hypothetical protein